MLEDISNNNFNQPNLDRFKSYPKGFNLLKLEECPECSLAEKKIMQLFKQKYIHRIDYGNEYFEGNPEEMRIDITNIILYIKNKQ
jgi:hypothetical protein